MLCQEAGLQGISRAFCNHAGESCALFSIIVTAPVYANGFSATLSMDKLKRKKMIKIYLCPSNSVDRKELTLKIGRVVMICLLFYFYNKISKANHSFLVVSFISLN